MHYTKAVDYKFHKDGSVKKFLGATIISFVKPHEPLYAEICTIREEAEHQVYASKFAFLPTSSYHMTNFVLYNDHPSDRNGMGWSSKIGADRPCEEINARLHEMLQGVSFPKLYHMRLSHIDDASLRLRPATHETTRALKEFRDACAEATGIYFADHESYEFHVTYAYRIVELEGAEEQALQLLLQKQTKRLREKLPEFTIGAPQYCTFEDMAYFKPHGLS